MDTFVEDFLNWGVSQLQGLPPTMFDAVLERKKNSQAKERSPLDEESHRSEGRAINRGTPQQLPRKQQHGSASSIIVGLRTVSSDEEGDIDEEHAETSYASIGVVDERGGVRCKSGRRRKSKSGYPPHRSMSSPGQSRRGKGIDNVNDLGRRHDPTDEEVLAHLETWTEKHQSGSSSSSSSSEEGRTKRRKHRNGWLIDWLYWCRGYWCNAQWTNKISGRQMRCLPSSLFESKQRKRKRSTSDATIELEVPCGMFSRGRTTFGRLTPTSGNMDYDIDYSKTKDVKEMRNAGGTPIM